MEYKHLETHAIKNLIRELQKELQSRIDADKEKLLAEIREKAKALDIPLKNLIEEASLRKKRVLPPVKPKYQNRQNPKQTWTGRGRKPKWVVEKLDAGFSLEDLLIKSP